VAGEYIGFFAAMVVLAGLLVPLLGIRELRFYAIAGVVLMLFVYVLFVVFLNVPLTIVGPSGL
jgi:hypothetical protein